jgi:hypothetical protein
MISSPSLSLDPHSCDKAGLSPRTTIGPAIGAKGCPSQAGVNGVCTALISSTSSKAPRTSTVNSSPGSTVIVGGVCVLTEKRYSVRFALMVPLPLMRCRRRRGIAAQGLGIVQYRDDASGGRGGAAALRRLTG